MFANADSLFEVSFLSLHLLWSEIKFPWEFFWFLTNKDFNDTWLCMWFIFNQIALYKTILCGFYLPYIVFSFWQQWCLKITRRCRLYHNEIECWTLMTYIASLACKLGTVLLSVNAILISVSCNSVCTSTEIPALECQFLCSIVIPSGWQGTYIHT